jgi:hypothetical protein
MIMSERQPVNARTEELRHHLLVLETEYEMIRRSLDIGLFARDGAILSVLAAISAAAVILIVTGRQLRAGEYFAVIIGIVAVGLIAYFGPRYRREAEIRVEISQTKRLLNAELSKQEH